MKVPGVGGYHLPEGNKENSWCATWMAAILDYTVGLTQALLEVDVFNGRKARDSDALCHIITEKAFLVVNHVVFLLYTDD